MNQSDSPQSPVLRRVLDSDLCAGCGGCALVAPQAVAMAMSGRGYLRPVQTAPLSADQDRSIAGICPGLGQTVAASGRSDHILWGPYRSAWQGWANDADLRFRASSGGGLSAMLTHLLNSGTVDSVVQTGADPDQPMGNVSTLSETAGAVTGAAGSRYAPSAPLAALIPLLDTDKRYAFVGKPCDVAALRALARRDPRVDQRVPVMLSFFCAGVPAASGAAEIVRAMGADPAEVTAFRYRGMGWPGYATARLANGQDRQMSYHDSWGKILSPRVQHRCKICADGVGMAADIVCADAWHCDEAGYPLFAESDGVSLIMARTDLGESLLDAAETAGTLTRAPLDIDAIAPMQPGQVRRKTALHARLLGLKLVGATAPDYRGMNLTKAALTQPFRAYFRSLLGMIRRRPRRG